MRTIADADVHALLIVLPLVLFAISLGFDVVAMLSGAPVWGVAATTNLAAGLACAAVSGVYFARVHHMRRPGTRARQKSFLFLWLSGCALAPFAVSLSLRLVRGDGQAPAASVLLSILALGAATLSGFVGDDASREHA